MIRVVCNYCGKELMEPGAIVISPPLDEKWTVKKLHKCKSCWDRDDLKIANFTVGGK